MTSKLGLDVFVAGIAKVKIKVLLQYQGNRTNVVSFKWSDVLFPIQCALLWIIKNDKDITLGGGHFWHV